MHEKLDGRCATNILQKSLLKITQHIIALFRRTSCLLFLVIVNIQQKLCQKKRIYFVIKQMFVVAHDEIERNATHHITHIHSIPHTINT